MVEEDPATGLVKIAKPVGVVAALIPTTGPDATPPVKTLFALKGRNAIICAPHPRTRRTTEAVVSYMRARNGLPFTLSLSCGTWGGNITTENVNARHFINLTWVSRPIEPKSITEEALFAAHWRSYGR